MISNREGIIALSSVAIAVIIVLSASGPLVASMQAHALPQPIPYCRLHPFAPGCHPPGPYCRLHPFAPGCCRPGMYCIQAHNRR